MKKIILLLLVLSSTLNFAQIKVEKKYDEFNKTTKFEIKKIKVNQSMTTLIQCDIAKLCGKIDDDSTHCGYSIFFYSNKSFGDSVSNSHLIFLFEDETTKKILYEGSLSFDAVAIYFRLTEEELKEIASKKLKKIRISTSENNDYEIKPERELKLKEAIQALLNAK